MLAAAIALPGMSGAAWAGGSDDFVCSNAMLRGNYAFSVLTVTTTPGVPNVVVVLGTFDGRGGYTQIDYLGDGLLMTPPLDPLSNWSDRPLQCKTGLPRLPNDRSRRRGDRHERLCDQQWRPFVPWYRRGAHGVRNTGARAE